jgi:hypothetical protein
VLDLEVGGWGSTVPVGTNQTNTGTTSYWGQLWSVVQGSDWFHEHD